MSKQLIKQVRPHVALYRDPTTGLAWVEDGTAGVGHSCHPNISGSGSVNAMKANGSWHKSARVVRSHGFIYNVDEVVTSDELDRLALAHCQCPGRFCNSANQAAPARDAAAELIAAAEYCVGFGDASINPTLRKRLVRALAAVESSR